MQQNITNKIMKAWYEMLTGISVPVYTVTAPADETGNYVLLRIESETDRTNNSKFVTYPVLITEVVTKFKVAINYKTAAEIDSEISEKLFPSSPGQLGLPLQDDIQISSVTRVNSTYLPEDDGTFKYLTLITRNVHRVVQLQLTS